MRVSIDKQKNLWGRQGDGLTLEPQRSDLWYVDLTNAVKGVNDSFRQFYPSDSPLIPDLFPQFVAAVTFPTFTVKPDVFRRSSIPYNMPVWDDPLDPIKITFLLEQNNRSQSTVYEFVTKWQALVRLGRGSRHLEGPANTDRWPGPETDALPQFVFDFQIQLLRGGGSTPLRTITAAEMAQLNSLAQQARSSQRQIQDALKLGNLRTQFFTSPVATSSTASRVTGTTGYLETASTFLVSRAWLSGFKVSDLAYTQSNLVTLEATVYAASIVVDSANAGTDWIP